MAVRSLRASKTPSGGYPTALKPDPNRGPGGGVPGGVGGGRQTPEKGGEPTTVPAGGGRPGGV